MKAEFNRIIEITEQDPGEVGDHLNKLIEEVGELAQLINIYRKRKTLTEPISYERLRRHAIHEGADVIQCVFAIMTEFEVSFEELTEALAIKNEKYQKFVDDTKTGVIYKAKQI